MANYNDFCQSFMFNDLHVSGNVVKLNDSFKKIIELQKVNEKAAELLGQVLTAAVMLIQPLKTVAEITIQFQSNNNIKLLAAKVNAKGELRATIDCTSELTEALLGEGHLVVTLTHKDNTKPYQSIIQIKAGQTISNALADYFIQSEQMPTLFHFAVNKTTVSGIMLQQRQELVDQKEWETLCHLFCSISDDELLQLDSETLLYRLFNQYQVKVFPIKQAVFKCSCSLEKMQNAITSLGKEEVLEILKNKQVVEVTCDYCKNHYDFDSKDIETLFQQH